MVGIEHLISLVPTLIQLVPQIGIALLIQIQNPVDSDCVVTFFVLAELHLLPLLASWFVAPT